MENDAASLYPKVSHLINTILNLEKGRIFEVDGRRIYPSEVHLLLEVAGHPEANLTDLAARLGVTKGAVSQTQSRLADKGLLTKTRAPEGGNALRLQLTARGAEAVHHFRGKTSGLRAGVEQHLSGLSPAQRECISDFLDRLTTGIQQLGDG